MSDFALVRDPIFGLPLTPFERAVWLGILRPKKSWPDRMWLLLRRALTPFGPGSGGAGGNVSSAELGTVPGAIQGSTSWPVWLYPTPDFQNFDKFGSTALAAPPQTGTVGDGVYANGNSMPWTVPKGFNGFIKTLAIQDTAGTWVPGTPAAAPLALSFSLTVNGVAPPDYGLLNYSPGLVVAPSPIAGVPVKEQNKVQISFANNDVTPGGAGDWAIARLQGYYYGKQYEPKGLAF